MKISFVILNLILFSNLSFASDEQNNEVKITVREDEVKSLYILVDDIGEPISYADACRKYPEYCPSENNKKQEVFKTKEDVKPISRLIVGPTVGGTEKGNTNSKSDKGITGGFQFLNYDQNDKSYTQAHMRIDEKGGEGKFSTINTNGNAFELNLSPGLWGAGAGVGWSTRDGKNLSAILLGAAISSTSGKNGTDLSSIGCGEVPLKFKHVAVFNGYAFMEVDLGAKYLKCKNYSRTDEEKNQKGVFAPLADLQIVAPIGESLFLKANMGSETSVNSSHFNDKLTLETNPRVSLQLGYNIDVGQKSKSK